MGNLHKLIKKTTLMVGLLLSLSCFADSSVDGSQQSLEQQPAKQCLKDLHVNEEAMDEETRLAKLEDEKKKDANWFEKLVKQHKLGSLHFQDIIELFH